MKLSLLARLSIAGCLAGLLLLALMTSYSAIRLKDQLSAVDDLLSVRERIDDFSVASDTLVMLGADPTLLAAYGREADAIQATLTELGAEHPDALKGAERVALMANLVRQAQDLVDQGSIEPSRDSLTISPAQRIVMQRVAGHGIALDTALDDAVRERQQAINRRIGWTAVMLAGSALFFGLLCVVAFSLLNRRVGRPVRALVGVLRRIEAGDRQARAPVDGDDELAQLAGSLNRAMDERDTALQELEDTRDRLVRAQYVAHIGSWDVDLRHRRLEWSDQVFEIFGISREAFAGTEDAFFEMIHPDDLDSFLDKRQSWLDNGGEFDEDHRIVRPDGEVRWVRERARIIQGPDGTPAFTTGTVQDITEHYALDQQQREFLQLIEGSQDWYGIIDDSYHFIWANQAYAGRYGLDPKAIPGMSLPRIIGEAYFEDVVRPRIDRCLGGETQRFETVRDLPGESERHLLVRYYPVDMPGRSARRVGAVITDITDMRQAQEETARQARLLDMAGRAARFGAWYVNLSPESIEWSDVVADIHARPHGYSPSLEEAIGYYVPEDRERISRLFGACAERGEPFDDELRIVDAEGRKKWVRSVGEPVHDEHGGIVGVQGAFQEISERKQLERESRRLSERLAAMLESITDGFVAFDEGWRYTYVNAEAEHMLGKTSAELKGSTVWSRFPELIGTDMEKALRCAMDEQKTAVAEEYFEPLGIWFDIHVYPWDEGVAVFFRDVSDKQRMLEQLRAQKAALRASSEELRQALETQRVLVNSLPAHIALLDPEGEVIEVNDQWRHFGECNDYRNSADSDFGVGLNYLELCADATGECAVEAATVADGLQQVLDGQRESFALEYPCHSPDEQRWFRVMFNSISGNESAHLGAVAMHVDVTQRKLAERRIQRLAFEDPLTGLHSRHGLISGLEERFARSGWPQRGLVVMVDVVNQRDINDAYGYTAGDAVLNALGRRLVEAVGHQGMTARTGGDEFGLFTTIEDTSNPEKFMARLDQIVDRPFDLEERDISLEIDLSAGYTVLGDKPRTPQELLREAELALFEHRGRTLPGEKPVAYTDTIEEQSRHRIRMTFELKQALKNEEFELHFQPKVNLADGCMISAEALIRWRHPERGLLSPGLFIPVAEQSQLIGPIGDWALRAACRQLKQWESDNLDAVRVAVNVSQVQFMLGDFSGKVRAALEEFEVKPEQLSLEITESVFERHSDRLLSEMRALHELGVRLSLDDFGTGYSSLLYIQRYPFDEIKIDRGFVDRIIDDTYSHDIVAAVLNMARALDAEVIAEGIESRAIAEALVKLGCQYGQGYYYSMPLESEDFRWLLQQRSRLPLNSIKD